MKSTTVLFAFGMLILATMSVHANEETCEGENEQYEKCIPKDPMTCANQVEIMLGCKPGCTCKPLYIRDSWPGGKCIPLDDCPK
uniref:TIL domain-containing protein n=1 Tax=Anopheles merus TaxID=30066 RepID=A0A2Y9D319_ANOME